MQSPTLIRNNLRVTRASTITKHFDDGFIRNGISLIFILSFVEGFGSDEFFPNFQTAYSLHIHLNVAQ